MADIYFDVDTALAEVPVNAFPLIDDTDFKSIEGAVAYNAAGMALRWHFVTSGGAYSVTSVTPTTGGSYDWTDQGDSGIYTIEIPASGGASINNDTEGYGWFTGVITGILPFKSPIYGFRAAAVNDALCDGGDLLDVSVTQFGGTAGTFASGRAEVNLSHIAGSAVSTTTAQLGVNVVQISTDATAADNLELAYDGTGYAGGTTPQQVILTASGLTAAADSVWDENITGHRAANSAGAMLQPMHGGVCQAGGNTTTIVLASGASSADDYYNGDRIDGWVTADGTNKFSDYILDYVGATRTATVTGIPVSPDATYSYNITGGGTIPGASAPAASDNAAAVWNAARASYVAAGSFGQAVGGEISHAGTAQGGTTASVTLASGAESSTNNLYRYHQVEIVSGTGAGQVSYATTYTASSRVLAVDPAFAVAPDNTSVYILRKTGLDAATPAVVAAAVWDKNRVDHVAAGSFGEYVSADTVRISGDATAANNAESFFDGTGYAGTNNVIPLVTTVTTLTGHTAQTGDAFARLGAPAGASVSADVAAVKVDTAAILVDTGTTLDGAISTLTTNVATVDTVVDGIKAKTDSLTFTVAGQVDANVQSINDALLEGDGSAETPWGVA